MRLDSINQLPAHLRTRNKRLFAPAQNLHPERFAYPLVIGLDPGQHTGFAVWDRRTRALQEVLTLDFWGAAARLDAAQRNGWQAEVWIEDARLISGIYRQRNVDADTGRLAAAKGQSVGMVKAHCALLAEKAQLLGFPVQLIKPQGAKWDAAEFGRWTGWTGRTSEHARDAARLVVGA